MDHQTNRPAGRSVAAKVVGIVILLFLLILNVPKLCFFLSPSQQEAVKLFNETYFGSFLPMRSDTGGFDIMRLAALALMILGCWAAYQVVCWIFSRVKTKTHRGETIRGMVLNVIRYVLVIIAVVFGLGVLGADVLTVIASLGILALVIGFGAQSLIEDMFAGFFILLEERFYVGDIISVDGFRGTVRSIGIVSTKIEDVGGNVRVINNSNIRSMTNLSNAPSVAVVNPSIAYGADLKKAEEVVRSLCEKMPGMYPEFFPKPPRYMGVEELNESSVDLRVIADVDEANIYHARRALNRELKLAFDEAGIEIPFPQLVVWQGK